MTTKLPRQIYAWWEDDGEQFLNALDEIPLGVQTNVGIYQLVEEGEAVSETKWIPKKR